MKAINKSGKAIKRRTVQFSPHSRNLFFHILTACNLKCAHCYINQEQHGTRTLDADTIKKWLDLFSRSNSSKAIKDVQDTNVIFLGGEPTLNPALALGIKEARRLGYASVTVDTNGYLFHNILERVTPEEVDYFSFSLDGSCPEVNDAIRGNGSFDTCTAGIQRAVELGFSVSSIFTANAGNIHDLPNMPELLKRLGVSRFFIQVIGIRGKSAKGRGPLLQLTKQEWESIVPETAQKAAELGLICHYPTVFLSKDGPFECAGLVAENYFVFPNGRVYTCPLCEDYPLHSYEIENGRLIKRPPITETELFSLKIPEGCVMNKLLHPGNLSYDSNGDPLYKIACCMLKEEISIA